MDDAKGHHCRFCVLLENVYVRLLYIVLLGAVYCGSSLYVSLMWPSEPSVFMFYNALVTDSVWQ